MMLLTIIITAVLLLLSFPPFNFAFLTYFSLVPLFLYIRVKSIPAQKSFLIGFTGYALGLVFIFAGLIKNYGFLFYLYAVLYHAILSGGIIALIYFITKKESRTVRTLIVASSFVVIDYIKTLTFLSFPCSLDLTQSENIFLMQIVKITGHYGMELLLIIVNLIFTELFYLVKTGVNKILPIFLSFVIIFLILLTKFLPVSSDNYHTRAVTIAVLQTALPISAYCCSNKAEIFFLYAQQIQTVQADLLIIPEGLGKIITEPNQIITLKTIASNKNLGMLINIDDVNINYTKRYNASALIENNGSMWQYYHKTRPIPLAEREYHPGKKSQRLISFNGYKIGVNICFESLYPEIARQQVKKGASFLVVQANDAGFTDRIIPEIHKRYTLFRAVENGVYAVHASQAGPSALISPIGSIISESGLFEKTNLTESILVTRSKTFYNQYGDLLVYICLAILAIYILLKLLQRFAGFGTSANTV